jgi:phospholipid/cholesterol/gamma-HCH transport system permease protein
MSARRLLDFSATPEKLELVGSGAWTAVNAPELEGLIQLAPPPDARRVRIDMGGVKEFDTFGAWILERLARAYGPPRNVEIDGLPERFQGLLDTVAATNRQAAPASGHDHWLLTRLQAIGGGVEAFGADGLRYLGMIGEFTAALAAGLVAPRRLRFIPFVHQLDRVGWRSIPIIVLITLLIGAIIAQQGIFHFRRFGAEDYVVDLVGILILREIGVLLVSIMVAGRSGSSYTAEIGSMKMREEIDALRTMGRDPIEVLVLPRVLALVVALPMLTFIGAMAALYGGGLVAWLYGGMAPSIYLARLQEAVSISDFEVGMIKAPFMALAIGLVACAEGLKVKGSAESLGLQTTTSVVKSIFIVILLDGLFAIFFSSIGM